MNLLFQSKLLHIQEYMKGALKLLMKLTGKVGLCSLRA